MRNKDEIFPETGIVTNVIILAGGNSSRMNFPKAWLPFDNEQNILEHIISQYSAIRCKKIVVVLNKLFIDDYSELISRITENAIIIRNENPENGRIHSLKLGIKNINKTGRTFIHNVDNPYADYSTLTALLRQHDMGYARPVFNNSGGHPILVSDKILETILNADDKAILRDLLNTHNCNNVDVSNEHVLCNINTPEDYTRHIEKSSSEFLSIDSRKRRKKGITMPSTALSQQYMPQNTVRSFNDGMTKCELI